MRTVIASFFLVALVGASALAADRKLDDFEQVSGWTASASEEAIVEVAQDAGRDGMAMRIDFEFPPIGGFVLVRKEFSLPLPENYAFTFDLRGEAPPNDVEFKIVDPTKKSVWWRKLRGFAFPTEWTEMTVQKSRIELAWGSGAGRMPRAVGGIELAISTGQGGKGSVWIDNLAFEERASSRVYTRAATVRASTSLDGHEPEKITDGDPETAWKSGSVAGDQWVLVDFGKDREYGGLVIDWDPQDYATSYQVQVSDDGESWTTASTSTKGNGGRDYVYMPDAESRYLRLQLHQASRGEGYAIAALRVEPFAFSASPNQFFQAVAEDAPPATYPKYLHGEQAYWTVVGAEGDDKEALLDDRGMLEVDLGSFSIEPFVYADGRLVGSSEVVASQELEEGYLPIPSVTWTSDRFTLTVTAFAAGEAGNSTLYARYRVKTRSEAPQRLTLYLAIRPFQVNPPWQSLNMEGGVARIDEITLRDRTVWVNGEKEIICLTPPERFGATAFEQGSVTDFLMLDNLPPDQFVKDPHGFASAALAYRLDLKPETATDVVLAIPFHGSTAPADTAGAPEPASPLEDVAGRLHETKEHWRTVLDHVGLELAEEYQEIVRTLKTTLAYILINQDGPRLQPGSRDYARSWIRDGALTSSALLQTGFTEEPRDFVKWFAQYQFPDGRIPCCVDDHGADRAVEHDSHGQFVYAIAEIYDYTRDVGFVAEMWPRVVAAVHYLSSLREQRMTDVFRTDAKRAFFGLLPESISHEGYSDRPVHSFWDDFFALRGLKDAARLAVIMGDRENAERFAKLRDAFRQDLYASIERTMARHAIDYIPASVELGDFDPNSIAIALGPVRETENLPEAALRRTFSRYYDFFRQRRDGEIHWDSLTPYEVRNAEAFVRLGERTRALEIIEYMLANQRPVAWNQWPEILWRDADSPRFVGDMPHTWVGAQYIRSVRSLFAYERDSDGSLVIAAGIPAEWVSQGRRVAVERLPTHYGVLAYTLETEPSGSLKLRLGGDLDLPPGKVVIRPPLARPLTTVSVNGQPIDTFSGEEAIIADFPAEVVLESRPPEAQARSEP